MKNYSYPSLLTSVIRNKDNYATLLEACYSATARQDHVAMSGWGTVIGCAETLQKKEKQSYVVSSSLVEALKQVDTSEVGPWHLQGVQAFHFLFKKNQVGDGVHTYNEICCLIIPPGEQVGVFQNQHKDMHKISLAMYNTSILESSSAFTYLGARYKNGSTMEEILETARPEIKTEFAMEFGMEFKEELLRLILNLILYVNTADEAILSLKPKLMNRKSFKNDYFKKIGFENTLGIYSLGWDFHGRDYHVSIGTRKGHFKWQPCGPQWSQRKLIWVEATTVNYGGKSDEDI